MMKFIKWKTLIISCTVCLLPILLGVAMWSDLPDFIAIHFDFYSQPDNFASKTVAVYGLPVMMAVLQIFCCIITDLNTCKRGENKKIESVSKWIIPVTTIVLHIATLGYAIGWNIDMRKVAALISGVIFIVLGNYMPKMDYVKNYNLDTEKARKINRFMGFASVIMGILAIVTIFLPSDATAVWLFLLIPYTVTGIIYGIKVAKTAKL